MRQLLTLMRHLYAYPAPMFLVFLASVVGTADPGRPVSRSIPVALGAYRFPVMGIVLLTAALLYGRLRRKAVDRMLDALCDPKRPGDEHAD